MLIPSECIIKPVLLQQDFRKTKADMDNNKIVSIVNKNNGGINHSFAYQKKLSKPIIDEIDKVLAKHYGFTEEELDFIINYDIKYRMGDELNDE